MSERFLDGEHKLHLGDRIPVGDVVGTGIGRYGQGRVVEHVLKNRSELIDHIRESFSGWRFQNPPAEIRRRQAFDRWAYSIQSSGQVGGLSPDGIRTDAVNTRIRK